MVVPFNTTTFNGSDRALVIPTAPPLDTNDSLGVSENLYDPNMYVEFMVIHNNNSSTVRAEKKAILESSIELAKVITGATTTRRIDGKFVINDIEVDNFELIIRYLETKFIKFRNTSHTLKIFEAAVHFNCPDLIKECVKDLDLHLSVTNIMEVFRTVWCYNAFEPPPITYRGRCRKPKQQPFTPEEFIAALLNNCLQLIDMEAEAIFSKAEMLNLRFEELEVIVKRNTLQMESDIILYDLLANWSKEECTRKNLEFTAENRRRVLGALCYTPRYLTIPFKEFESACSRVELLDDVETKLVRDAIKGKRIPNLSSEQSTMLTNFKKSRPIYPKLPIHLSDRSNPKNYSKKMRKYSPDTEGECCNTFVLNCLSIFACIFD